MPALETLLDKNAVRAAIRVNMTSAELGDDIIGLPIFSGAAILEVKNRVPGAEDLTGDPLLHVTNAINLLTAAFIVDSLPQIKRSKTAEGDEIELFGLATSASFLRERAGEEIAIVVEAPASVAGQPVMFTLARGYRGRC